MRIILEYQNIIKELDNIKPLEYAKNRNFINGSVSKLSPYISRGVISTKQILDHLLNKGFQSKEIEKYIQELAWRDYWQLVWIEKNIDFDLKQKQLGVNQEGIAKCIVEAKTGIEAIDQAIIELYQVGYMHNHLRMYLASIATNIAKSHWAIPAKWMYYNLLDGDWASNSLSWQWVCGANSNKKYFANQENINKYTFSKQTSTFLDTSYESIAAMNPPSSFSSMVTEVGESNLPDSDNFVISDEKEVCIYNYYNLDPIWRKELDAHRILLLEPSIFAKYPIGQKAMDFMISLSQNIPAVRIFVGEFHELQFGESKVYFKEHPLNYNYKGVEDSRDWLCGIKGYYSSFFGFWKKAKKELSL